MSNSRKARTREAILRAILDLTLKEKPLTKAAVCANTPCSPATLYRFFPDLDVALRESFLSLAAKAIGAQYYEGLVKALDDHKSLEARLQAIVRMQGFFIRSNRDFVREVAKTVSLDPELQTEPGKLAKIFPDKIIFDAVPNLTSEAAVDRLREPLRRLIGYTAMDDTYTSAQRLGSTYEVLCEAVIQDVLKQFALVTNNSAPGQSLPASSKNGVPLFSILDG